jgi:hypothetical protein
MRRIDTGVRTELSYGLLSLYPATTARLQAIDAKMIDSSPYQE